MFAAITLSDASILRILIGSGESRDVRTAEREFEAKSKQPRLLELRIEGLILRFAIHPSSPYSVT